VRVPTVLAWIPSLDNLKCYQLYFALSFLRSISSTFYMQIFHTKVLWAAFFYLHVTKEMLPKKTFVQKIGRGRLFRIRELLSFLFRQKATVTSNLTKAWNYLHWFIHVYGNQGMYFKIQPNAENTCEMW